MIVANPIRLLEIIEENAKLINMNYVNFLIVDEYIQFRKTQTMDYVKKIVDKLRVRRINKNIIHIKFTIFNLISLIDKQRYLVDLYRQAFKDKVMNL